MTTTSIPAAAYVPAAALAAAAVLPSCTPKRRLLTVLTVAGARAWADEQIDPKAFYFFGIRDTGVLTPETEHLVSRAGSSLVVGLAALPVVGLVRLLPGGRLLGGVALAGGYLAADRGMRATFEDMKARAEAAKAAPAV